MEWVVLTHVLAAFWLIAGIVGRDVTLAKARRASEVRDVVTIADVAGRFDGLLVIPGSMAVLLLGLASVWAEHLNITTSGNRWALAALVLYLSIMPFIPLVFIPKGKVFDAALADAAAQGKITPELTASLHDPLTRTARTYEWIAIGLVVVLMVVKPF
jgi:Predicted integral membrane protein (DUF2269)